MRKTTLMLLLPCVLSACVSDRLPDSVEPMIQTQWGQDTPFNILCPWFELDGEKVHYPAGCGPVAMAQLVNHDRHTDKCAYNKYPYNWDMMYDRAQEGLSEAELYTVARLITDCGKATDIRYRQQNSTVTNANIMTRGLRQAFGYSRYTHTVYRDSERGTRRDSMFVSLLRHELAESRPVIFRGQKKHDENSGHIFIIDGYEGDMYHVNMGWGGESDGYYALDDINGFSERQWMTVGAGDSTYVPEIRHIRTETPGMLDKIIRPTDSHVRISGPLDSADIATLRKMAGRHGELCTADLREAEIKKLPRFAFAGCYKLVYIALPDNMTEIGAAAFYKCAALGTVMLPGRLRAIPKMAFYMCGNLTAIDLPASLRSIGDMAFHHCDGLTSVRIPDSVEHIGHRAFAYSYNLETIQLPAGLKNATDDITESCYRLRQIKLTPQNRHYKIKERKLIPISDHAKAFAEQTEMAEKRHRDSLRTNAERIRKK